jgi:Flp pilus assembly protein TadD
VPVQRVPPSRVRALAERLKGLARSPDALASLARAELALGERAEALTHIGRALELRPSCWQCRITRALALAATGRHALALQDVRIALNLLPHDFTAERAALEEFQRNLHAVVSPVATLGIRAAPASVD